MIRIRSKAGIALKGRGKSDYQRWLLFFILYSKGDTSTKVNSALYALTDCPILLEFPGFSTAEQKRPWDSLNEQRD